MRIDDRQFLDLVFLHNHLGAVEIGVLGRRHQPVAGHHIAHRPAHFLFETQVAVGDNTHQALLIIDNRNASNAVFAHESDGIAQHRIGM